MLNKSHPLPVYCTSLLFVSFLWSILCYFYNCYYEQLPHSCIQLLQVGYLVMNGCSPVRNHSQAKIPQSQNLLNYRMCNGGIKHSRFCILRMDWTLSWSFFTLLLHIGIIYFRCWKCRKMIGGLFIYNHKGEVLISRVYRDDIG